MQTNLRSLESKHFIFHYVENSYAASYIEEILALQEKCFDEISSCLQFVPDVKIDYWLCESDEMVAELAGCPPYNGYAVYENGVADIYCVYNSLMDCTGYHEITHIIADAYNEITCSALAEGLAVYFEKTWWTVSNLLCVHTFLKHEKYVSVQELIHKEDMFYSVHCAYSYPIMGAFVEYLINNNGIEKFRQLYAYTKTDWEMEFQRIYAVPLETLEQDFIRYVQAINYAEEEIRNAEEILKDVL